MAQRRVRFSYAKGRRFEYEVKKMLERDGFYVVRSAKSIFPDLIALKDKEIRLIECKVNKYLSSIEQFELKKLAEKTGGTGYRAYPTYQGRRKFVKLEAIT